MRGKRRIFGFAALLSVLLAAPLVFSLGILDLPKFSSAGPLSSTASVFSDPVKNITDYWDRSGGGPYGGHNVTVGSTVAFHINISDVTDLFTWQINMTWDSSILNVSKIIPSEFLARSVNKTSSEELGWVINFTDNAQGCCLFAESILGNVSGIPGPTGGRLVTIEFLIVGYGSTDLTITTSGSLPTMLLNSTVGADPIVFVKTDGYFRNKLEGDASGNEVVDGGDISEVIYYRDAGGPGGYNRDVDVDDNGAIDGGDISYIIFNRERHTDFSN